MKVRIGNYRLAAAFFLLFMWLGYPDYLHIYWLIGSGLFAIAGLFLVLPPVGSVAA